LKYDTGQDDPAATRQIEEFATGICNAKAIGNTKIIEGRGTDGLQKDITFGFAQKRDTGLTQI